MAPVLNKFLKLPKCAEHSQLKKEFHYEGIQELLEIALSDDELSELVKEQKKKIVQVEHEYKPLELPALEGYFKKGMTKLERNIGVLKAVVDGHKQSSIAKYLRVSDSTIVKIKNKK